MYGKRHRQLGGKLNPDQLGRDQWYGLGHRLGAEHQALKSDSGWIWGIASLAGMTVLALLLTTTPPKPVQLAQKTLPACRHQAADPMLLQPQSGEKNGYHATCS